MIIPGLRPGGKGVCAVTKAEKREHIMNLLKWYKELEDHDVETANYIIAHGGEPDHVLDGVMKYGRYFPIKDLWGTIGTAMDFCTVDVDWKSDNRSDLGGLHDVVNGKTVIFHHQRLTYKTVGYSKEDFSIIQAIIDRMAEQGYIMVSKSGNGFRVLKVD